MKVDCKNEEDLQHYKDKTLMLKMLCLEDMGHNPMTDVSSLNKRLKVKLLVDIEKRWDDTDVLEKFNELCIQTIFDEKYDYTKLPVISTTSVIPAE